MQSIGDRILLLRREFNISQKTLAELAGVTEASLSRYENNLREPRAEIIGRIASVLDVTTDYLLGRTDVRNPHDYELIRALSNDDPELLELLKVFATRKDLKVILRQLLEVDKDELKPLAKMIAGLISEDKEIELINMSSEEEAKKYVNDLGKDCKYKIMKNEE